MKYIRTKDGKIYKTQETKSGEKYLVRTNELIPLWNTNEYEIINQADTIEELCDEFVFDGIVWDKLEDVMFCLEKEDYTKIYGAIWTDKGLIYVAKMNEKGKLELL